MQKTILHVDLDEIIYLVAYRNEHESDELYVLLDLQGEINRRLGLVEHDEVIYYLSCSREANFRRRLMPSYKAHRDKREAPRWIRRLKYYSETFLNVRSHPHLEADDLIGLAITNQDGNTNIAVTQDKDVRTVPGLSINPNTNPPLFSETSVEEALYNLMKQVLTGDSADGYKGCPNIGPKKADKILQGTTHRGWQKIYRAYLKAGLTKEDLRLQYLMARILRRKNYVCK